ncbi:MAG: glycosyltransferase family 4 protein [Clostridia bacterium]|nr:glycosyltransferase family 4 protein [Clostridia bacterium]
MNLLFLTLFDLKSLNEKNIYTDLLRVFVEEGHNVVVISPTERRHGEETKLVQEGNAQILKLKIGNIQKTNIIEKGISTVLLEPQMKAAIKKYFSDIKFDMVMYSTPPITFANVIKFVKKRDGAKSYLLLKDIFPQNAVDLGMFSKKSPIYTFFRNKEKALYNLSDRIGCMSQANVDFVIKHNPYIDENKVHISPNSVELLDVKIDAEVKENIRKKYGIPTDKKVFIYGGNLGKPQDIPFIIECLKAAENKNDRFFVICGTGTEYSMIKAYVENEKPNNVLLINGLPPEEYETFVASADVGLIFLDHRFTIPNFPSRILSYMQNAMPVIACTDKVTDIGKVIEDGGFGWWCESTDAEEFTKLCDKACESDLGQMGERAKICLAENYSTKRSYEIIMECE